MAETIPITVPDGGTARVNRALAAQFDFANAGKPGETKGQFAERQTKRWWREIVLAQEANTAVQNARNAVVNNQSDPMIAESL